MKKSALIYIILTTLMVANMPVCKAQSDVKAENLMAVHTYNFTRFLEWPGEDTSRNFVIKIFGESSIREPLELIATQKTVKGKKIVIEEIDQIADIENCKILFISNNEKEHLEEILQKTEEENVLTVANIKGFGAKGVGINFIQSGNKMKFEINLKELNNAGIKSSKLLLKLATAIYK